MIKISVIVQARMGSERLPGKVAREIKDKPVLAHIIARLKNAQTIDDIIIATSNKSDDDRVVEIAKENGVEYYRGSEVNVLSRYLEAGKRYNSDIIIRVTGDCPLIDPVIIDEVTKAFMKSDCEYMRLDVSDDGYPRGLDVEIFNYDALLEVERLINKDREQGKYVDPYLEHVTLYIYRNQDKFSLAYYYPPEDLKRNYRLCIDEKADFQLIRTLYDHFYDEGKTIDVRQVIEYLDKHPEIANINQAVNQKMT